MTKSTTVRKRKLPTGNEAEDEVEDAAEEAEAEAEAAPPQLHAEMTPLTVSLRSNPVPGGIPLKKRAVETPPASSNQKKTASRELAPAAAFWRETLQVYQLALPVRSAGVSRSFQRQLELQAQAEQEKRYDGYPDDNDNQGWADMEEPTVIESLVGCYWMSPPSAIIEGMTPEERRCVPKFMVGRTGYGTAIFYDVDLEDVDLITQHLCRLVWFEHRSVVVYPDDAFKPPIGEKLNRPATIMLEQCWPKGYGFERPLLPGDRRYRRYVRLLSKAENTEFVAYGGLTGTWMFNVSHF